VWYSLNGTRVVEGEYTAWDYPKELTLS
jgi:hypothetical protein